jgi:hypothetical protein
MLYRENRWRRAQPTPFQHNNHCTGMGIIGYWLPDQLAYIPVRK